MTRFIVCVGLVFVLAFSAAMTVSMLVGHRMPYIGELHYFANEFGVDVPYHMDVVSGVTVRGSEMFYDGYPNWSSNNQYIFVPALDGTFLTDNLGRFPRTLWNQTVRLIWSDDYTRLVFDEPHVQISSIHLGRGDGTELTLFAPNGEGNYQHPSFSPDGTQLAYIFNDDLYVASLVDGSSTRLTNTPAQIKQYPTWSPDAQRIAFWWNTGNINYSNLSIIDIDGENRRELSEDSWIINLPAWSQDGRQLAFFALVDDYIHVFLADATTGAVRILPSSYPLNIYGSIQWETEQTVRVEWASRRADGPLLHYIDVVDIITGEELQHEPFDNTIAAVSPDERWSATYENGNLCILAHDTGEIQRCSFIRGEAVRDFRWLP